MKILKLFLTAILLMVAYVANAQTILIYKDGAVVKEFSSAEVDSVVYKPAAAQPRYYYYAGWTKPNSEIELAEYGVEILNFESMPIGAHIKLFEGELTGSYEDWYIVVPNNVGIYGPDWANLVEDTFETPDTKSISGYRIFKKWGPRIAGYTLKKK